MSLIKHHLTLNGCECGKPVVCPEILDAEIMHVDKVLERNGFGHLNGARGVEAAFDLLLARAEAERQAHSLNRNDECRATSLTSCIYRDGGGGLSVHGGVVT